MGIETVFNFGDIVRSDHYDIEGVVVSMCIGRRSKAIQVGFESERNGRIKGHLLFENELRLIEKECCKTTKEQHAET